MRILSFRLLVILLAVLWLLPACGDKKLVISDTSDNYKDTLVNIGDDEDWVSNDDDEYDIPSDPSIDLPAVQFNNLTPTATFGLDEDNEDIVRVNIPGMLDPNTGDPIEFVANENIFIEEDGTVKGLRVTKVSQDNVLKADLVFCVDNSGSMGQESDSVAAGIIAFAQLLEAGGLDVRFACVGYSGQVYGGLNFTDAEGLEVYLTSRPGYTSGTSRTRGFAGADSAALHTAATTFAPDVWGENGVVGALFAHENYNWRSGASRNYINFTDEPTQPNGHAEWSTSHMCDVLGGNSTVHTVFSEDTTYYSWTDLDDERPWAMSECTGGTIFFTDYQATDLDLSDLPIVGALTNSYLIEFVTTDPDGTHTVRIVIKIDGADGTVLYLDITYGG